MIPLLQSVLSLGIVLLVCRFARLTAAMEHLAIMLTLICLPLLPLITLLTPISLALETSYLTITLPALEPPLETSTGSAGDRVAAQAIGFAWRGGLGVVYGGIVLLLFAGRVGALLETGVWHSKTRVLDDAAFTQRVGTERLSRVVELRLSDETGSPLTWGVRRPSIVVPSDWYEWTDEKRQICLTHELAHIRNLDALTTAIASVVCCLFWANPLVWIARKRMIDASELACDDVVVMHDGIAPTKYASYLLTIARESNFNAATAMASTSVLSRRVEALLSSNTRRIMMKKRHYLAVVSVILGVFMGIGSLNADTDKTGEAPVLSESAYRVLSEAQQLIENGEMTQAIENLAGILEGDANRAEVAQAHNTLAFAYYRLDDRPNTIRSYLEVLKHGPLSDGMKQNVYRSLAQLYYADKEYHQSVYFIDRLLAATDIPDPGMVYIKATAFLQLNELNEALATALELERVASQQGQPVKEPWLYLQLVAYERLDRQDDVIAVLERLNAMYPSERYEKHLQAEKGESG